ncbi:MAG: 6-phosphofructokinase [Lentisphaerae bacterium]|nr:6-phosphofructokinase [Lentisphaerota bacterium]
MLIAQSGGPTAVINRSLVGAIQEAKRHKEIQDIYGARHGIKGLLAENMINLRRESAANLAAVAATPSAALGSVRKKPAQEECCRIFDVLQKYNVRYLFYIGGNDSAETTQIIADEAIKLNYEFRCFHIPKTIDNDLLENDHTPGFGSAAKFVACAVLGSSLDNSALPGVTIDVIMGRHAGFLAAASALARVHPDDGPHLIYLPERPFDMAQYLYDVKRVYDRLGRCVVVVSEGISDTAGTAIATKFTSETDAHGNVQLSGTGALGDLLANEIRSKTPITRVRADTFGYLQRSFPGLVSETDEREARAVGVLAVRWSVGSPSRSAMAERGRSKSGSVAIRRKPGRKYAVFFECVPLAAVAKATRHMPEAFINKEGNDVTQAFLDYVRPIVGPLPKVARLRGVRVPRLG